MKITLLIPDGSDQALLKLKHSIEKASIDEIKEVTIRRQTERAGEMGTGGLISSVAVVIEAERPIHWWNWLNVYNCMLRITAAS